MTIRVLPRLYLVTNRHQTQGRPLPTLVRESLQAGTRLIQLREKDLDTRDLTELALTLRALTREYGASLLINDRIDIAMAVKADGVHLRADSLPVRETRRMLGADALIGVSTHSVDDVRRAQEAGADFVVLGPIFDTPSKRGFGPPIGIGTLREAREGCRIPLFAIGGITPERVPEVTGAGAYGVAVISSILEAPSVKAATERFLASFTVS